MKLELLGSTARSSPQGKGVLGSVVGSAVSGAANAALFAAAMLAHDHPEVARQLAEFRTRQTQAARDMRVPPQA